MLGSRTFASKENKMSSVYEVIMERECDPHPGYFSLWHTGNGSLHSELRKYVWRRDLIEDAKLEGYKIFKLDE